MGKGDGFWRSALNLLRKQKQVVLMIVVSSRGSSPGTSGNKMVLAKDGPIIGTIGGGAIEHSLIEKARGLLAGSGGKTPQLLRKVHHFSKGDRQSGMICGGEQSVAVYLCTDQQLELFTMLEKSEKARSSGVLTATDQGLEWIESQGENIIPSFRQQTENAWEYQETIGACITVYIIGGGHVSLALSKVLAMLKYEVVVIDERENLQTMYDNNSARQKLTVSYKKLTEVIPEGERVVILIMTHSHSKDEQVVAMLADKKVRYIGVLGSRSKIAQMKRNLSEEVSLDLLDKLHAPVGLPIMSHTPAEIAISISAELIQHINSSLQLKAGN